MADEKNITLDQLKDFAVRADKRLDDAESNIKSAQSTANSAQSTANSAQSTANSAQSTANAALPKSGGTMTGEAIAQNNTNYTTKQMRNIFLIAEGASMPSGANGDICLVYEP